MSDVDSFEPTTLDKVLHYIFVMTGFLAIFSVYSPMRFLFRKVGKQFIAKPNSTTQSYRSEQKKLGDYRWFLTAIVISGLLWDVHIAIFLSPFPLLPHIAFWADGILVYIHSRFVVYLLAFALFLIYLWLTTLLLAFLYRFYAIADMSKKKVIHAAAYLVVFTCIFNTVVSCGILIIRYPEDSRILCAINENHREMLFLYRKPAFIYFVKLDEFLYARIGLAHITVAIVFYVVIFLFVLVSIHVSLRRLHDIMSANTIQMHRTLIKALMAQMILPMVSLCIPLIGAAAGIKLGTIVSPTLSKIGGQFGLMITCLHSPLNTVSMILYVRPFRRYVLGLSLAVPRGSAPQIVSSGPTHTNHRSL